jgi:Ca2+-binding RTX toxin-like protein
MVTYGDRGPDAASGVAVALAGGAASGAGAPGENDSLAAIENLQGTGKNDALSGDDGANIIQGPDGDDAITGGRGVDLLYGGGGNDAINAVDQGADRLSCGGPQLARRSAGFVGKRKLTLKPSRRYRAHLRKGQRIRQRLTLSDQARNRATKTVVIRLK